MTGFFFRIDSIEMSLIVFLNFVLIKSTMQNAEKCAGQHETESCMSNFFKFVYCVRMKKVPVELKQPVPHLSYPIYGTKPDTKSRQLLE